MLKKLFNRHYRDLEEVAFEVKVSRATLMIKKPTPLGKWLTVVYSHNYMYSILAMFSIDEKMVHHSML